MTRAPTASALTFRHRVRRRRPFISSASVSRAGRASSATSPSVSFRFYINQVHFGFKPSFPALLSHAFAAKISLAFTIISICVPYTAETSFRDVLIDACTSNPCLFGGACSVGATPNTHQCECLVNELNQQVYEGVNCQERVNTDLCSGQCSDCVQDYRINGPLCMCPPGERQGSRTPTPSSPPPNTLTTSSSQAQTLIGLSMILLSFDCDVTQINYNPLDDDDDVFGDLCRDSGQLLRHRSVHGSSATLRQSEQIRLCQQSDCHY